jgi:branched-chain amino acid transport system substrate-binding protein
MKRWFLLLAGSFLLAGCGPKEDANTIVIGEYGSLTGGQATFGTSTHEGLMLAVEQANEAGGVKGKKITVVTLDDEGKPEEAVVAATKLINQDHVKALIGEVASSNSIAAAPVAQAAHVPMISPSSTNIEVTRKGDYIFRVCFIDPFQGKVMADFSSNNLKAKTAAILRDIKSDYSVGLADVFKARFTALGGKLVADESYASGDIDFKAQLTTLRAKKPDVVFVPGYYTEVGLIAKQASQLGLKAPLLGGDGWDSSKLYEIGGKALDGCYFSNHYTSESADPRVVDYLAKYKAKYNGKVPDSLGTLGYDAGKVLIGAMNRAKSLDGPDLRDAIAATKDFPGVTGNITIDKDRNAVKPAVVLKIQDSQAHYVATVAP